MKQLEIYVRETRDEYGYYPNWPVYAPLKLGQIGYYHGRSAKFEWVTSLESLGIPFKFEAGFRGFDELQTTEGHVQYDFSFDEPSKVIQGSFIFAKKHSRATQGYQIQISRILTHDLSHEIITRIANKTLKWEKDWVVVTELAEGESFTTLISGDRKSEISLTAKISGAITDFNIADHTLGLGVKKAKSMCYKGIAEKGARPFFQICTLVNRDGVPHSLRHKGRGLLEFFE